jgi:very-short-patch-repair endonuclease
MTPPERRLWKHLRARALGGLRFRRQHPIGPFIADFYCHDVSLVAEIDGATHRGDRKDLDTRRDRWMSERGLRTVRVRAVDVRDNLEGVLALIERTALERIGSGRKTGGTPSDPPRPSDGPGHLPRR